MKNDGTFYMNWMKNCYSRLLIDNHITDLKPKFMSRFNPAEYVRMVKSAGVDSAMVYACDHNGNCYYPTQVGHRHSNLDGRDILGETIKLLRQKDIVPIAYYTVIFHNDSAKTHPAWRQHDANGQDHGGRYHYSCPNNSDYVAFVKRQLDEIAAYDINGFFIDMTYWPLVCQCDSCCRKYLNETGLEIPQTIDWNNPDWVKFQRARERWIAEFAAGLTAHLKAINPKLSVTHQFSPVLHGWLLGQSSGIALASDYTSGDFYGSKYQQRLGAKIFAAYSRHLPYEFMTSTCVNLKDHTSTKSEDELFLHAGTTLANGGAYLFINAINPDGTLNERVYRRLSRVGQRLRRFKDCIQSHVPSLLADCGLYFSLNSCVNELISGTELKKLAEGGLNMDVRYNAVVDEITGATVILNKMKLPYRVITDTVSNFSGLKSLVINNAAYLSAAEVERIRTFVRGGGTLIATSKTSLYDLDGNSSGDFQLADVFGVSYSGKSAGSISYLQTDTEHDLVSSAKLSAPLVNATTAQVMGTVVEADFPVNDPEQYASIHSNPPGIFTDYAGLTINRYGKGQCLYLYSSLLKHQQDSQQQFGRELFRKFIPSPILEAKNLPDSTEVTILQSSTSRTLLCCLVNYQDELPNIPVCNLQLVLQLPVGFTAQRLTGISDGQVIAFTVKENCLAFNVDKLNDLEMIEIAGE